MNKRIHPRWSMNLRSWNGKKGKAQVSLQLRRAERESNSIELPEPVLRLAQEEYDRQFPGQPYERMQERGGLSVLEIIGFMADRIERTEKLGPWKPEHAVQTTARAAHSDPAHSRVDSEAPTSALRPESTAPVNPVQEDVASGS